MGITRDCQAPIDKEDVEIKFIIDGSIKLWTSLQSFLPQYLLIILH